MARWDPGAPERLQQAAYELYAERGYDATTVAQIAERAGLTKRTYFRHFADKREVLFWRSELLTELFVAAVAEAPEGVAPLEAAAAGMIAGAEFLGGRREFAQRRQALLLANSELEERELIKLSRLAGGVADALRDRGVDDVAATLAAHSVVTVFRVAFDRWVAPGETRTYVEVASEMLDGLRAVVGE